MLKYLVLTTMLMGSDINPFDSQETKPYKNDPRNPYREQIAKEDVSAHH